MAVETKKWDIVEHLNSDERIALFLEAVFEDGDPAVIAAAIGDVARARGMSQVAKDAGLSRENLYRALSEGGNPEFATIVKVVRAIGYDLTIVPHDAAAR
ncbi:putative addiction module antidote protein [Neorhizobium sp. R1-B]|jgi:probable addiction module antidote protein|uniref:addiction module antidote protein n=1 Tax=unclassified Neorhizobium TaxID=2629175 RepID=UPI001051750C|nr:MULTISPECIES: addiction module antidote protein [unclassified Neorhizobium]TCV72809.1 putative addiction module antidote protein [Neorhizobium sp. S3-V5DH]TDX88089.1 putative addiction module antidote protein [Neorhizobium sp. R1-B]